MIAELTGGQRDVFTAACADQLAGLHGPKGKPCPALGLPALPAGGVRPRHAANLLRLKAFFSRQWQQMPAAQFMAVFGPYSQRIGQVLDQFDPAVVAAAARGVSDRDDELPLRPEESTRWRRPRLPSGGRSEYAGRDGNGHRYGKRPDHEEYRS